MSRTMPVCPCALAAALALTAGAADLHVPSQHATIQAAIDAAAPGDAVIVAAGVYGGPGNRDIDFGGKAITVRSAGGPAVTIIQVQATPEHPARGVRFVSGEGPTSVLEGFTITGGATPPGAIADDFNGGGILVNNGSSPVIRNCVIAGNQCGCWGAGICVSNGSPTIIDCALLDNRADDNGGGLFAWGNGTPLVINTLIAGNDGGSTGGGVALFTSGTTIVNSTITGNTADAAPGVHVFGSTIVNSIVWGNGTGQILGNPLISFSNVQGGFAGPGNVDVDPQFVDAPGGDYHLSPVSPLVDAGSTAMVPAWVTVDPDGDPRVIGPRVDIGADEMLLAGDLDFDGGVGVGDLLLLLQAWGPCGGCAADLNGDGAVDLADLILVLVNWSS